VPKIEAARQEIARNAGNMDKEWRMADAGYGDSSIGTVIDC
jgi:hypothetical protein